MEISQTMSPSFSFSFLSLSLSTFSASFSESNGQRWSMSGIFSALLEKRLGGTEAGYCVLYRKSKFESSWSLKADHLDIITVHASETRNQNMFVDTGASVSAAMTSTQTVTCISLKLAEYTLLTSESRFSFKLNTLPGDMTHLDAATIWPLHYSVQNSRFNTYHSH